LSCFSLNPTSPAELSTLSLHDALPISHRAGRPPVETGRGGENRRPGRWSTTPTGSTGRIIRSLTCPVTPRPYSFPETTGSSASRSEEHTSELQSQSNLVCRLLLEKKKK